MDKKNIRKLLETTFSTSDKEQWSRTATAEVNGNEPLNFLSWKDADNVEYFPYYERSDTAELSFLRGFDLPPSHEPFFGNRRWHNLPPENVRDESVANRNALEHLKHGADGVCFILENGGADINLLLKGIQPQYCSLAFAGDVAPSLLTSLDAFFSRSLDPPGCTVFTRTFAQWDIFIGSDSIRIGPDVQASTPAREIADALFGGVQLLGQSQSTNERAIGRIAFSIPLQTNLLSDISKIRALRFLWFQVARAFGIESFQPHMLYIHCRSESSGLRHDEAMLKNTTAAIAGICGGCDALSLFPVKNDDTLMRRIARNASSILKEESRLDKVSDPVAGAYIIDVMVAKIARKAWMLFQENLNEAS